MNYVQILSHPLVEDKMGRLRDHVTQTSDFRRLVEELTLFLCMEATTDLALEEKTVATPVATTIAKQIAPEIVLAPVLRAGLGMVEGMLRLVPSAKVGHIGFYRDEKTLMPVEYYVNLPTVQRGIVFLLDPMLATGGTAVAAISLLKQRGIADIRLLCLVAAPQGIQKVHAQHPDVKIFATALDEGLNDNGYIVPGLGDAGDRIFGTLD